MDGDQAVVATRIVMLWVCCLAKARMRVRRSSPYYWTAGSKGMRGDVLECPVKQGSALVCLG